MHTGVGRTNRSQVYFLFVALIAVSILLSAPVSLLAQSAAAKGVISGAVTDPQGSAVAGAQITIRSTDFTSARTLATSSAGTFTAAMLDPGAYTITVKAPGFALKKPARVILGVGSSVQLTIRLGVAGTSQNVTVPGRGPTVEGNTLPPAVNKETPQVSNTLAGLTVTYLPNRDRDFSQFGQLAAGVQPAAQLHRSDCRWPASHRVQRAVDGFDFNRSTEWRRARSSGWFLFFPQTVVCNFRLFMPERRPKKEDTNAGFVNVITKEGSNKYHGEAFYIGRPAWTADDAFGHSLDNAQNEFGGSLGGPIKKNRAFFYVGAEQDYVNIPYWTEFEPQAPGTVVPSYLSSLQRQIVGNSDPTSVFAAQIFCSTGEHSQPAVQLQSRECQ